MHGFLAETGEVPPVDFMSTNDLVLTLVFGGF